MRATPDGLRAELEKVELRPGIALVDGAGFAALGRATLIVAVAPSLSERAALGAARLTLDEPRPDVAAAVIARIAGGSAAGEP